MYADPPRFRDLTPHTLRRMKKFYRSPTVDEPIGIVAASEIPSPLVSLDIEAAPEVETPHKKNTGHDDTYRYHQLPDEKKNIRLLELLPGAWDEEIHCRLTVTSTRPFPPYEAISYCWGNPKNTRGIICDGKLLNITWNLRNALRQLRLPDNPRTLWADAICINQQDDKERGHQAMQMGAIFSEAETVLVWLGQGTKKDAPAVFQLIESLQPILEGLKNPRDAGDSEKIKNFLDQSPRETWAKLGELLYYPWFRRIWVTQEVGLAAKATLICGNATICWETFSTACAFLRYRRVTLSSIGIKTPNLTALQLVNNMQRLRFKDGRYVDIIDILSMGWNFRSTDPRDKIYALLGHPAFKKACQNLSLESFVSIEYSRSVFDTYLKVSRRLLNGPRPLYLLSFVGNDPADIDHGREDFISWVPQWHSRFALMIIGRSWDLYCASAPSVPNFSVEMRAISLHGTSLAQSIYCFDVFKREIFKWKGVESRAYLKPKVLSFIWSNLKDIMSKKKEEEIFQDLCSVINAGGILRSTGTTLPAVTATERLADLFAYFRAIGVSLSFDDDFLRSLPKDGDLFRFFSTTGICRNRRLFVTEEGHMGLGPAAMKPGDLVCIFFGADTPFIIRKKPGTDNYWLCGECYVKGLMNGEAMAMLDEGKLKEEVFTLV